MTDIVCKVRWRRWLAVGLGGLLLTACSSSNATLLFHNNTDTATYDVYVDGGYVTRIHPGDTSDGHSVSPGTHVTQYTVPGTTNVVCTFSSNVSGGDTRQLNGCN